VQASKYPERVFTTLHHLVDVDFLREAYRCTRKDAAAGVDEVTAKEYAANLEANLQSLFQRYKEGSYVAPPVRAIALYKESLIVKTYT
jgi:RNA-directed DNA polymerase